MELEIYSFDGEHLGSVDEFESLRWRRKYFTYGEFELHCKATQKNVEILVEDSIVRRADRKESAIINYVQTVGGQINAQGYMLSWVLEDAVIDGQKTYTGKAEEIIAQIITEDVERNAPGRYRLDPNIPEGDGGVESVQIEHKNALSVINALARSANLGVRVIFSEKLPWTVQIYKGVDRTYDQHENSRVQFSTDFGNFTAPTYTRESRALRNVAIVYGSDGTRVEVDQHTGQRRREVIVEAQSVTPDDVSHEEYIAALEAKGRSELLARGATRNFEGEAIDRVNFAYTEDWDLGDLVPAGDESINVLENQRITEVEEVYEGARQSVTPVFGTAERETLNVEGL